MNAGYRGKMPLLHIIQECPTADSQARYTAKPILPLVLAELNSYKIWLVLGAGAVRRGSLWDLYRTRYPLI